MAKRLSEIVPHRTSGEREYYYLADVGRAIFNPTAELGGTHEELTAQKTRESAARTKLLERKDAIEAADVVPGPEVDALISRIAGDIGGGFRSFPAQLANRVVGLGAPEIKQIAADMVCEILATLQEKALNHD